MMHSRRVSDLVLLVSVVALVGCREDATQARQRQSSHLRSLLTLFNLAESKLGHRPASEAEFKSFIKDKGQATLDALHLASVDDLFISDFDGQPFVVLYGEQPKGPTHEVVACEQKGVEVNGWPDIRWARFSRLTAQDLRRSQRRPSSPANKQLPAKAGLYLAKRISSM